MVEVCIPRTQMPQLDHMRLEQFYRYLQEQSVDHFREPMFIAWIKKMQCADTFDPKRFAPGHDPIPPLVLSQEALILDGNHRYEFLKRQGLLTADSIVLRLPFHECRQVLLAAPAVYRVDTAGKAVSDAA